MARGESVCPNQVTITPRMSADACATDGTGMSRSGVSIAFSGCQVGNGSQLDGSIDVQGTRTLSNAACAAGTMVTTTSAAEMVVMSATIGALPRLPEPALGRCVEPHSVR